jgi:hypothetical protein
MYSIVGMQPRNVQLKAELSALNHSGSSMLLIRSEAHQIPTSLFDSCSPGHTGIVAMRNFKGTSPVLRN